MPTIEIDYVLADSQIPAAALTATGTWDNATPPTITSTMQSSAGNIPGTVNVDNGGTWTAMFSAPTAGATYNLRAQFGNTTDDEGNIRVLDNNPVVRIDTATVVATIAADKTNMFTYTVTGYYDKGNNLGKTGVCLAVTRDGNKKIQSIDAAKPIPMQGNQGNWTVTFTFTDNEVPQNKKLVFIALMINADAAPVARSGRKGPKRP